MRHDAVHRDRMVKAITPRRGSWRYLMTVLALAAAYCIAGRLGLLLAIPPGYASGIWPPSGIALAGVLGWGYGVWPGIVLGSFLVNIWTSFDATSVASVLTSVALATSIGGGAALHALGGAFLVKRCVGFPNPLTQAREISLFLVLGGPVSCLMSATIGVTSLLVGGMIPPALFLFSWWTWWVGDTIGVLIVTPFVLVWTAESHQVWRRRRFSMVVPLAVTLTVAIVFFVYASAWDRDRVKVTFEQQAERLGQTLRESFDGYLDVLHAIESFYASSSSVERQGFHIFVQPLLARHPGIQALSWDRRVPDAQRAVYEEAVRQEGYPDFQITEQQAPGQLGRAAQRLEYVAVSYIEPYAENESVLGYDVSTDPDRLEALDHARDTGEARATGRVKLIQESGQQAGILIFLPLYDNRFPHANVEERRQHLRGYATGVFRLGDMLEASLPAVEREGMTLQLYDETAAVGQRLLYTLRDRRPRSPDHGVDAESMARPLGLQRSMTIELAGHRWMLSFTPTLAYLAAQQTWQPWVVLVGGLLFTSLFGGFLLVITGHTANIEQLVTQRTAELSQANTTLAQLAAIVESSIDAIMSITLDGRMVSWNAGAERMYGYTFAEVQGRPGALLVSPEHLDAMPYMLDILQRGERVAPYESTHVRKDGELIDVSLTVSPLYTATGQVVGASVIARDVTARKQAETALAQAMKSLKAQNRLLADTRDQAWQATRAKSAFLASMSHEIRTPMNAILGMADLLEDTPLTPTQLDYVQRFKRAGADLLLLINDILDLSKIEADQLELEQIPFDLDELLNTVAELMAVRAHAKGVELLCSVAPDVPTHRLGDPHRLRQILVNLLSNAIKFTDTGAVSLRVTHEPRRQEPDRLRFSVCDTGIGIPTEKLEAIFESFTQVDTSTTRQYGGTGLGLSISEKLAALMDGRIWAESHLGQGSTFHLTVQCALNPTAPAPLMPETCGQPAVGPPLPPPGAAPSRGLTILLAEDNADNQLLIQLYLKHTAHHLTLVENGAVALDRFKAGHYDLVLMDIQMPVMDGYTATARMRQWEQAQHCAPTLIVALTANALPEDIKHSLDAGCDGHLSKPIKKAALLAALADYAGRLATA